MELHMIERAIRDLHIRREEQESANHYLEDMEL